jgi:hypothetical protein
MTQSQYYTSLPTVSSMAPAAASAPAPNSAADLVMSFAPVHALPTTPATHCAPGRCDICDTQHLIVLQQSNSQNGLHTGPLLHRRTCRPRFYPDHPGIDVESHSLEAGKYFYVAIPARDPGIYTSS